MGIAAGPVPQGALVAKELGLTIRRVGVPAVFSTLLMSAPQTVDTYWIGRHLGRTVLAGTVSSVFWIWILLSVGEIVSVGASALGARRHGKGKLRAAARIVGDSVSTALLLGTAVAVFMPLALPMLFSGLHADSGAAAAGAPYLRAYLYGTPFIFGYLAVEAGFRASGDTLTPLAILMVATAIGIVLAPVLILGLGGAPALGALGAAIATIVPRGLAFVVGLSLLYRRRLIELGCPRPRVLLKIVDIGAPAGATGIAFSIVYVVLTPVTMQFGTRAFSALGVGFRIESAVYMLAVGLGAAVAAIVGQSLGAGLKERARKAGWLGVLLATVPGAVMAAALLLWPASFASAFSSDSAVVAEAARYLRIVAVSQLFLGAEVVLESALGGAGYTLLPMLVSTAITALRVPFGAWSAARWGTDGLWWTIALTSIARGLAMAWIWRAGKWQEKRV